MGNLQFRDVKGAEPLSEEVRHREVGLERIKVLTLECYLQRIHAGGIDITNRGR